MDDAARVSALSVLRIPFASDARARLSPLGFVVRALLLVPLAVLGALALVIASVVATGVLIVRPFTSRTRARG